MSGTGRPTYRTRKASEDPAHSYLLSAHQMARSMPNHTKLKMRPKKEFNKEEMLKKLEEINGPTVKITNAKEFEELDADSEPDSSLSDSDDSSSEDDQEALMNELMRLKKERAEEEDRRRKDQLQKEQSKYTSNALLNPDYSMKVDWREETVFKNQAMNVPENEGSHKQYVNDPVRNEYHKRFLRKYIHN